MPFKTTANQLFNDICYLLMGYFDLKIGVFLTNSCKGFIVSLIAIFRKLFASINTIFVFAGRLGTSLSFYEV